MSDYSTPGGENVEILQSIIDGTEYDKEPTSEISALLLQLKDGVGGGVSYSLEEQDTGLTWIDGSRIYQKTIDFGTLPVAGNTKEVNHGIENIDFVIEIIFPIKSESLGQYRMLPVISRGNVNGQTSMYITDTVIGVLCGTSADAESAFSGLVTLRYIKTGNNS